MLDLPPSVTNNEPEVDYGSILQFLLSGTTMSSLHCPRLMTYIPPFCIGIKNQYPVSLKQKQHQEKSW